MLCLTAGAIAVTLAAQSFTLSWIHSVEKTEIQEDYAVAADTLRLTEARIKGSGAGFDPPPGARLADGWWRWQPGTTHDAIRLTRTAAPGDWRLCIDGICRPVGDYVTAPGETAVTVTACPAQR